MNHLINRLPRLARYLQAVFIVTNSFGSLNKLETGLNSYKMGMGFLFFSGLCSNILK